MNNSYQQKLFESLQALVERNEAFFFKDFVRDERVYRIYNYNLASWTLFQEPGAIEARGIMFDVTQPSRPVLVSAPPQKFFNYEEGGVDHTRGRLGDKMVKMDGSLISTYLHGGELFLKTKGSLYSEQAIAAMALLDTEKYRGLRQEMRSLASQGYTVNLEYTSPENRIVVPYQEAALTVLCMRSHTAGENLFASKLIEKLTKSGKYPNMLAHMVEFESLRERDINQIDYMDQLRAEQSGEGYVIEVIGPDDKSYLVKAKNLKYVALHHTKDSVNSPKRLFEAIIEEASDDLRALFADDQYVLNKIAEMERHVHPIYNHIITTVDKFYEANKELGRKEYAILAKSEGSKFMGLLMNRYLGNKNDYKEFAKKWRVEIFGVKEEPMLTSLKETPVDSTAIKAFPRGMRP